MLRPLFFLFQDLVHITSDGVDGFTRREDRRRFTHGAPVRRQRY